MSMVMSTLLAASIFRLWQLPLVLALIGLIIFWKKYRDKQV